MQLPRDAVLLRIFFGEEDKANRLPLYEAIVLKAREMHLAGATVLRGHMGFGHSTRLHTTKILRLSEDLPLLVEIVDTQEKIDKFLPVLDNIPGSPPWAMCGRLGVGKKNLHVAGLVGAAMCSACLRGTHDRWP
jgi:PII-like signaling protein